MATVTSQAGQAWHQGLKIRKHLLKQLEKLQADGASSVNVSQFETVNGLMEKFRFACVHTIFLDFEYAVRESAEEALWGLHTSINAEYRRTLGRLKPSSHAVERRKVDKMYHSFLRIAQQFYKGYIQRLSARYDVQELRRAARGIDAEQSDAGDAISPVPAALSAMVVVSCHSTLLRLGDLARYRTQAKHKGPGYERALTYYSLARDLMPQSGFAFHQMGIVNLDQANHLDVVYHFYRAWAVEVPHPNAKSNLESEFKSLRLPNAAKARPNPSAPQDAFNMWFAKLHALFYKGEDFSQQRELEEEVAHRLEMACRSAGSGNTLLKMALVNMSAYEIASNIAETKTESAWRFRQFTLRFNALFAMTFCGALKSELQEAVSNRGDDSSDLGATHITSIVEGLLPTLRVYSVWLAAHRHELFSAADAFGAVVPALMQNLVKVFTLLCVVIAGRENLASCPYLLPEDLEVRGLRTLTGDQVPRACRVSCDANGNTKPHVYDPERRLDVTKESMTRILDTLRCAYFLAEDGSVPVTCQVVESWLVFEYRPGAACATPDNNKEAGEYLASRSEAPAEHRPAQEEECARPLAASGQDGTGVDEHDAESPAQRHRKLSAAEEHAERTVISMLTPFLKPPTPQPQRQVRSPDASSSYGMHTATANDVFASARSYASPTAPRSAGPIAPFPWAWDNTPKPNALASAGKEAFHRASRDNSPRGSMTARTALDDPFTTPAHDAAELHAQAYFGLSVAGNSGSPAGPAAVQSHRELLLRSLTGSTAGPRTSPFAQWEEQQGAAAPPWDVPQAHGQVPASTSASSFSHPSSLYMGTPADGLGLGVSGYGVFGRSRRQSPSFGADASSSARRAQLGDSALSYDEAIFRAAWVGN